MSSNVTRMLARARAAGIPVFHIMHDAGQGSPYDVTAEIGQISDEVAPIAGEPVIVKNYPSSFFQTDLGAQLEKVGRGQHDRHPRAVRARRRPRARQLAAGCHPGRDR